jgi:hypothetical protein
MFFGEQNMFTLPITKFKKEFSIMEKNEKIKKENKEDEKIKKKEKRPKPEPVKLYKGSGGNGD